MPQYQVDSDQIQSSGAAVSASVAQIRQAVNGMYASVAAQWRTAQQQMEASLESIQQALSHASAVYADAESAASRLFAQ